MTDQNLDIMIKLLIPQSHARQIQNKIIVYRRTVDESSVWSSCDDGVISIC